MEVLRFYRPEDISQQQAYKADFWDVYASEEKVQVDVSSIVRKCTVSLEEQPGLLYVPPSKPPGLPLDMLHHHLSTSAKPLWCLVSALAWSHPANFDSFS